MNHSKTHHATIRNTDQGGIMIEGPISSSELQAYQFHEHLTAFRPPTQQHEALIKIADFPEGRIIIAHHNQTIIGYVTYLYPDPMERWAEQNIEELVVLGAIEVAPAYRGYGIASGLLEISMRDPFMENYIVISTEYYWHWDLKRTKLSVWEYRKVMEKMMAAGGLKPAPTDDPEIISHPANCLMVRIGSNVKEETVKQFDQLRFLKKYRFQKTRGDL